jgi:cytochrome c
MAAGVPGFNYSPAMKASGVTWNRASLDPHLASPPRVVPRGFMALATPSPTDRADIIAYLETLN